MSSKKITYSSDFKLKVLDYYFKHGGDDKFGLKKKTAGHFNIDKKTINRMLNNPEMVKRARKLLSSRKSTTSGKNQSSGSRPPVKPAVKKAGSTPSKVSSSTSRSASSSQSSASSSSSNRASTSLTTSTKSVNSSSKQVNSTPTKTPSQKPKPGISEDKGSPGVEVFELPEDPDYSLLKQSINAATDGVGGLAKLLVTGTEEVRNVVLNECDVILECKVCRNLFRSVVNFLAHKRIYCQDEFADVRTLFHKGDVQGLTSQSNTLVVEPEPPPDGEDINTMRTTIPTTYVSPLRSAQGKTKRSGIDSIALKLARKRKAYHATSASSSTNTGSSSYYKSLDEVSRCRDKLSRDCSVMLEDIGGVTNAVFQSFIPPGSTSPSMPMSNLIEEASQKSGVTVAINQNGEIVKTASGEIMSMEVDQPSAPSDSKDLTCLLCNTRFATQKTLSVHQRSTHGFERCIYSCPICQASFLSMWAVVKHLQRTHKKTKNQIDRLRKVVRKNVRKKIIYQKEEKKKDTPLSTKDDNEDEEEEEEEEKEENTISMSVKSNETVTPRKVGTGSSVQLSPEKGSTHKIENEERTSARSPDHRCEKCDRKFSTSSALESHGRFCSLMQMVPQKSTINPLLRSETPEKKIAIQIRRDYKKSISPFEQGLSCHGDPKVMFKVPKTPQEKENQSRIEEMMSEFCELPNFSCIPCGRRYQSITNLKRHAAFHMDWTRFQCNLCHFRNYYRYEVINHCVVKHNVKESIAGSMVAEIENVGQLKYFLDNEDAASISSDTDQDHSGDCDSTNEKRSLTALKKIFSENKLQTSNSEEIHAESKFIEQNKLHENKTADDCGGCEEVSSHKINNHNLKEGITNEIECTGSKENITVKKDIDLHKENKNPNFDGSECNPECCSIGKESIDSKPLSEEQKVQSNSANLDEVKFLSEASTSISLENQLNKVSNAPFINFPSAEKCDSDSHRNTTAIYEEKILKTVQVPSISKDNSVIQQQIVIESSKQSSEMQESELPELDMRKYSLVDTENSSSSSVPCFEKTFDAKDIQTTKVFPNNGDELFSKKIKLEAAEELQNLVIEYSSHEKDFDKGDSESISSSLEISEQGSVTESYDTEVVLQPIEMVDYADEETLDMGMESESLVEEHMLKPGGKIDWKEPGGGGILDKTEGIHEQTCKNPLLTDLCRFEDIKPSGLDRSLSVETDTKPLKDDLSLDFIGFPNTKDENVGRPSRLKRNVEHKDFIYETKRPFSRTSVYDEDDCLIMPSEEGRSSVRRRSSLKLDSIVKKSRNEEDGYKSQSCNGSSLTCTNSMKIEDLPVPQRENEDENELEPSYFETASIENENQKVRLVRSLPDSSPQGSMTLIDDDEEKSNETSKEKNLDKESESSSSSKSVKKASTTMTRHSSRLKLANSPLPTKDKRQDTLNTRIITNGQGQSNSSATTHNKVKL